MLSLIIRKIALIGANLSQDVRWQERAHAFRTWQQLSNARDASLSLADSERQQRLCMLSEIAWQRYVRLFELNMASAAS